MKKHSNNKSKSNPPNVGDDIVTEAIVVYSQATVVWQDGTIESGISSRHLYPIHHLDEHVSFLKKIHYFHNHVMSSRFLHRNFFLETLFCRVARATIWLIVTMVSFKKSITTVVRQWLNGFAHTPCRTHRSECIQTL